MPYPLLAGRHLQTVARGSTHVVLVIVAVVGVASVVAALRWQPHKAPPAAAQTPPPAVISVPTQPVASENFDEQVLHLAHAERQLVGAAEQLVRADRLLAALAPELARSYLQTERWRVENARGALDTARKALEESRDHIRLASQTGKE